MKRVLFVDDEPRILAGLRRMLRSLGSPWKMEFVANGDDALKHLRAFTVDVVVTDMRMPDMDGSQLLGKVMKRWPATVRIILSGHSDRDAVLKAVGPTHQFLAKPCDCDTLKRVVTGACRMRDKLTGCRYKRLVSCVQSIPSSPLVYDELRAELELPKASIRRVGRIIARDVGMTAKLMQLVSSGFFGTAMRVTHPIQAAERLGLDTIRPLVFHTKAIGPGKSDDIPVDFLEALMEHSFAVAGLAAEIARAEMEDRLLIGDSFLAGFLHDVGRLVLAQIAPRRFLETLTASRRETQPVRRSEKERSKATHAEIGAYLMALWGLPDAVVDAIGLHHCPGRSSDEAFSPLTAVHVASALLNEETAGSHFDVRYLEQIGLADRLDTWRELCRESRPEGVPS